MEGIYIVSAVFESAIILACVIFSVLLIVTGLLPDRVARNGILLFINIAFIAIFYLFINVGWTHIAIPIVWLFVPASITIGLFFYRFNTVWLNQEMKVDRILLFIPALVLLGAGILEILNYAYPESTNVQAIRIPFTEYTLRYLFPVYSAVLIGLNFHKLRKAERQNLNAYSTGFIVNLNWSRISLLFYLLFYIGVITSEFVGTIVSELVFNISILTLTLYLGYYQIKTIAKYLDSTKRVTVEEKKELVDANNAAIVDTEKVDFLFQKMNELVENDQLYLQVDLTIHELGQRMEMNSKYLSQAISHQGDLNFNKYINAKRIKYSTELLLSEDYKNISMEGIANESGFRSKSTFNTTFKSIMGCTPSEYKKKGLPS